MRSRFAYLGRYFAALPQWARLQLLRKRLAELEPCPSLPIEWFTLVPQLKEQAAVLCVKYAQQKAEQERLEKERSSLVLDEEIIASRRRLMDLQNAEKRYHASVELESRLIEFEQLAKQLAVLARKYGFSEDTKWSLVLPTVQEREAILQRCLEWDENSRRVRVAKEQLRLSAEKVWSKLQVGERFAPSIVSQASEAQRTLEPWDSRSLEALCRSKLEDLRTLDPPPEDVVESLKESLREAQNAQELSVQKLLEASKKCDLLSGRLEKMRRESQGVDLRFREAIAERDQLWLRHRQALEASCSDGVPNKALAKCLDLHSSANVFEVAMGRADEYRGALQELARLEHLQEELSLAECARERAKAELCSCRDRSAQEEELRRKLLEEVGLSPNASVGQLEGWMKAREASLEAGAEFAERYRDVVEAQKALQAWETAWEKLLRETRLGCLQIQKAQSGESATSCSSLRTILQGLGEIGSLVEKSNDLSDSIERMKGEREHFIVLVRTLAQDLGVCFDAERSSDVAAEMLRRLHEADKRQGLCERIGRDLERVVKEIDSLELQIKDIERKKEEMLEYLQGPEGSGSFDLILQKIETVREKSSVEVEIAGIEQELILQLHLSSAGEIERAMKLEEEREALVRESETLRTEIEAQEQELRQRYHDYQSAEGTLFAVGDDAAAAKMEEQRCTLLLEIEARADDYLRKTLGVRAFDRALDLYRSKHRSSMLRAAGGAFCEMTEGKFRSLEAFSRDGVEVLSGVRKDGSLLEASGDSMSTGTRFQLYLALRVAGYYEFIKHREALPFVADDIMETFDDGRTAKTLTVLQELAQHAQVIYLTHHSHLCEIAREVCGDSVKLHYLPG